MPELQGNESKISPLGVTGMFLSSNGHCVPQGSFEKQERDSESKIFREGEEARDSEKSCSLSLKALCPQNSLLLGEEGSSLLY